MDINLDSSRCKLESATSEHSMQVLKDELRLDHSSTPDSDKLVKKVVCLELDNERLKIDLENVRLELNAKNAANQSLKNKIGELYVEAQSSLQERQKLHNSLKDAECKVVAAENSTNWYRGQMHEVEARKNTLQIEIDTYQSMLRQKHLTLVNVTAKWKQLNDDFLNIMQKHRAEKDVLQAEIDKLKIREFNCKNLQQLALQQQPMAPLSSLKELTFRIETSDQELAKCKEELRTLEQRLTSTEVERSSLESTLKKQREILATTEERLRCCEAEKNEFAEAERELKLQVQCLRSENYESQRALLAAKQEREQVEDAIEQLHNQLTKMIAQHKLLKSRNLELEDKLSSLQGVCEENKKLRSLSYSANVSLFSRFKDQQRKRSCKFQKLTQEHTRNRHFERKFKLQGAKKSFHSPEESIDEGYADNGSLASLSLTTSIPSPSQISPELLNTINDVLHRSKDFWGPVRSSFDELRAKLDALSSLSSVKTRCSA